MSALTIRLPDDLAEEVAKRTQKLHISRSQYIRKSIEKGKNDSLRRRHYHFKYFIRLIIFKIKY